MRFRTAVLGFASVLAFVPFRPLAADSMPAWAFTRDDAPLRERAEHLDRLGADDWHAAGVRGQGVTVAVLDSGFRGYRDHLGRSLPKTVKAKSFRHDGNLEAKDSQHGILCGEVVHAVAPGAELLFANWESDDPDTFLAAVRWAREQGATVMTCSVIMPGWSDGEGGGAVHRELCQILGDGTAKGDALFFSCAGNVAQRHWAGEFKPGDDGFHRWAEKVTANPVRPWGDDRVSLELCWSDPESRYTIEVIDADTGKPLEKALRRDHADRLCTVARFRPEPGRDYAVRVRQEKGTPGRFHFTSLSAELGESTRAGSIPFPGDGPEVITVGAVNASGRRASFSACGPNSPRPKPDLVAPIPFTSYWRPKPFSGTSSATPQAAGAAALYWSSRPGWSAGKVRGELCGSARDLGPKGHDCETGFGMVRLPAPKRVSAKR